MKRNKLKIIDSIRIDSPCGQVWEEMEDRRSGKYCEHCNDRVWDFSEMTRLEAERVLIFRKGRHCVRIRRDSNGQILFKKRKIRP